MTNTKSTPIEAFERAYPMRVFAAGCAGTGLACGEGIERDLLMLEDVTVSLIAERGVEAVGSVRRRLGLAQPRSACRAPWLTRS